jgi:hypothetical protein
VRNNGDEAHPEGTQIKNMELFLTIHVADDRYFYELERDLKQFDSVLFEMVVANNTCSYDQEGRRTLRTRPTSSTEQKSIAESFGLCHQIDGLNYQQDDWYLTDLDSETLSKMQKSYYARAESWFAYGIRGTFFSQAARRLGRNAVQEWYASGGESFALLSERELFVLAASTAARAAAFLAPCPEILWLLLDWVSSNQGKMHADVLASVVRRTAMLDFAGARKLVYAQSLVSNQVQAPEGVYRVMLLARDSAATKAAVTELERPGKEDINKIALVYGVMHGRGILANALR